MQHILCELHTLNSALFNRPNIICFEQFSEIVISFSGFHLFNLTVDAVFISRGGNVAENRAHCPSWPISAAKCCLHSGHHAQECLAL